jgi:hypothetical protein
MTDHKDKDHAERESRRILEHVDRDSETVGSSSLARSANKAKKHFMGNDKDVDDPIEVWGTRIGRALSLIGVTVLVIYLYNTYFI